MSIRVMSAVWDGPVDEPGDLLILLAISNHADDDGMAHPSMQRIARLARMTERGARKAVRRLEEAGYLTAQVGAGPNGRNRYVVHPNPEQRELFRPEDAPKRRQPGTQSSALDPEPMSSARNSVPPGTNEFRPDPEPMSSGDPGTQSSAKPSITSESKKESVESEFARWYEHYPKKAGKGQALKAYRTARKKASAEDLLDGLQRYIDDLRGRKARGEFTPEWKNPATWLNGECWLDEAPPSAGAPDQEVRSGPFFPGRPGETYAEYHARLAAE